MVKKTTKKKSTSKKARKPAPQRSKRPAAVTVKNWALKYATMAECEEKESLTIAISLLVKSKTYLVAWQRGQLLRKLGELGGVALTIDEIAHELGMAADELEEIFNTDAEAYEIFNNARITSIVEYQRALAAEATAGKPTAARQMMNLMRREVAKKSTDFSRVSTAEMASLSGVSRQVINEQWVKKHDCPKNADGTYNLYKFIPWYHEFAIAKINRQPGKYTDRSADPVKDQRARKIQLDINERLGVLWPREQVISGLIARASAAKSYIDRKSADLPTLCANLPADKVSQQLDSFFTDLLKVLATVPSDLRNLKLDDALWGQIETLLKRICESEVTHETD